MEQPKFSVRGTYTITKRRNGEVIQEETFHNTILNEIVNYFGPEYRNKGTWGAGTGALIYNYSGTIAPNTKIRDITNAGGVIGNYFTTTALSKELNLDLTQLTWHKSFVVPANSSNVGTITGVVFFNHMSYYSSGGRAKYSLFSAALVSDSEGNPISIEKTQYDEVTVTAAWQWNAVAPNSGAKALLNLALNASDGIDCLIVSNNVDLTHSPPGLYFCPGYLYTANIIKGVVGTGTGAVTQTDNSQTWTESVNFNISDYSVWTKEDYTESKYYYYFNSIVDRNNLQWLFPNPEIFPIKTYKGAAFLLAPETTVVGTLKGYKITGKATTGDGVTVDYTPSLPAWVENTEKVYKNGVLLTRDVDYLVDNAHNRIADFFDTTCMSNFINLIEYYVDGVKKPLTECGKLVTTSTHFTTSSIPIVAKSYNRSGGAKTFDANEVFVVSVDTTACFSNTVDTLFTGDYVNVQSFTIEVSTDNQTTWQTLDLIGLTQRSVVYTSYATSHAQTAYALKQAYVGVTHIRISNMLKVGWFALGHVGDYAIRFIDPPLATDTITIECDVDRPFKNFNNALTCNLSWTLTI